MKVTISRRITAYLVGFSILIIGLIALLSKFVLPGYYTEYQVAIIEDYEGEIGAVYLEDKTAEAIQYMEELQKKVGGELYIQSEQGQFKGAGNGKNSQFPKSNQERFIPEGNVTSYTYTNKIGLEIYALGINVDGEYLIYEVSIQALDDVINVVLRFLAIILLMVLVLAFILAYIISRSISKPIKDLNELAREMKKKQIEPAMVSKNDDEIGELNHSLNALYEELLASIYHLEAELKKERNSEVLKKRFLAQATHELKTPVAIIRGYAEILYDGMYRDEEDRERYIKNIYEETDVISHLIIDVLEYTKMETGNYKLIERKVDSKKTYTEIIKRLKGYIDGANLKAKIFINLEEGKEIFVDAGRVEQVIRNLVSNAVEHATSTVEINISLSGNKVRTEVVNDGQCISEEDLPYIFDSFYKKSGKQTGTGLGLAIVKQIVLLHKGDYRVENMANGVRFIVYI